MSQLTDVIEKAIDDQLEEKDDKPKDQKIIDKKEDDDEDEDEDDSDESEDEDDDKESDDEKLTDAELKEARKLYNLIKNPSTRNQILREMATGVGLIKADGSSGDLTKKEETKAKKAIKDILAEKLGGGFEFLIPKLSDALEAIVDQEREDRYSELSEVQQAQINTEVGNELRKLAKETNGFSSSLEGKMAELSKQFPPGQGVSTKQYVRNLYYMAAEGRGPKSSNKAKNERIQRNSRDLPDRLGTRSGAVKDSPKDLPMMSLKDSIKYAINKVNEG